MKKHLLLLFITSSVSLFSFSQTTTQKLDSIKKDPKTKENAAKADAFIINKKIITPDSTKVIKTLADKRRKGYNRALKNKSNKSL